jgi:hypothetical protein
VKYEALAVTSLDLSPNTHRLNLNAGSFDKLYIKDGQTAFFATSASFETIIFFF